MMYVFVLVYSQSHLTKISHETKLTTIVKDNRKMNSTNFQVHKCNIKTVVPSNDFVCILRKFTIIKFPRQQDNIM